MLSKNLCASCQICSPFAKHRVPKKKLLISFAQTKVNEIDPLWKFMQAHWVYGYLIITHTIIVN